MATHTNLSSLFTDIADAIRTKTGETGQIVADNFPTKIAGLPSGVDLTNVSVIVYNTSSNDAYIGWAERDEAPVDELISSGSNMDFTNINIKDMSTVIHAYDESYSNLPISVYYDTSWSKLVVEITDGGGVNILNGEITLTAKDYNLTISGLPTSAKRIIIHSPSNSGNYSATYTITYTDIDIENNTIGTVCYATPHIYTTKQTFTFVDGVLTIGKTDDLSVNMGYVTGTYQYLCIY